MQAVDKIRHMPPASHLCGSRQSTVLNHFSSATRDDFALLGHMCQKIGIIMSEKDFCSVTEKML